MKCGLLSFIPHPTKWGPMRFQVVIKHYLHVLAAFNANLTFRFQRTKTKFQVY